MPKRVLTGTVVSDKADKTVVVRVERRVKHPLYGKIIKLSKKYHAHDEGNAYREGERCASRRCAPISKLKTWTVLDRVGAARRRRGQARRAEADAEAEAPKAEPKAPRSRRRSRAEDGRRPKPATDAGRRLKFEGRSRTDDPDAVQPRGRRQ